MATLRPRETEPQSWKGARLMTLGDERWEGRARTREVILVAGFATPGVLWALAYLGHLPALALPGPVLGVLLLAGMLFGGGLAGRWGQQPLACGLGAGALGAALNLLVVAGAVAGGPDSERSLASWLGLTAGWLATGALLGGGGALLGRLWPAPFAPGDALRWMTRIAVLTTFLLVILGGVVTSTDAGLAVPDWPTTFGSNMFLFPLQKMVGGVYYEHTHRLYGALVGLVTLATGTLLVVNDPRGRLRVWAVLAMVLVIAQGILGAQRVTRAEVDPELANALRLAAEPTAAPLGEGDAASAPIPDGPPDTPIGRALAVVHGVTGQLFLGLMAVLAAWCSRAWWSLPGNGGALARKDRRLVGILVGLVLVQLVLGALLRQYGRGAWLLPHIIWAFVILGHAFVVSARAGALHRAHACVVHSGWATGALFVLQLALGFAALTATAPTAAGPFAVLVPTAHQAVGGLILACVFVHWQWLRRLDGARE